MIEIGSIVEGHGEVESLPILIRRIATEYYSNTPCTTSRPVRVARERLFRLGEFERTLELVRRNAGNPGGIIVLLDCDDGCPVEEAERLQERTPSGRQTPVEIVLAVREYEGWFLAGLHSLAGRRGLTADVTAHPNPESVRGAKEWITKQMLRRVYSPPLDQPAFTQLFDLRAAEQCRSFRQLVKAVGRLLKSE